MTQTAPTPRQLTQQDDETSEADFKACEHTLVRRLGAAILQVQLKIGDAWRRSAVTRTPQGCTDALGYIGLLRRKLGFYRLKEQQARMELGDTTPRPGRKTDPSIPISDD